MFQPARKARRIYKFRHNEVDVANSVKWAIEATTGITRVFREGELPWKHRQPRCGA